MSCDDIRKALRPEIRDIVAGSQRGRTGDSQSTLFDATGLAIQVVICARKVYEVAEQKKLGIQTDSLCSYGVLMRCADAPAIVRGGDKANTPVRL